MSRRDLVLVEGLVRPTKSKTAFVKRGAPKVRLHGRWFRRTDRLTEAGIPVYEPMIEVTTEEKTE